MVVLEFTHIGGQKVGPPCKVEHRPAILSNRIAIEGGYLARITSRRVKLVLTSDSKIRSDPETQLVPSYRKRIRGFLL